MRFVSASIICLGFTALWFSKCSHTLDDRQLKEYPEIITSNRLWELYDTAKFYLYSYHCDVPFDPVGIKEKSLYFSYLDLSFDTLIKRGDTAEILFKFVYRGKSVDEYRLNKFVYVKNGIAFNLTSEERIYMTSARNLTVSEIGATSRYVMALQPDVIEFVQTHKQRINPWYRKKLEQLGVFH